jgi:hypothetical protein
LKRRSSLEQTGSRRLTMKRERSGDTVQMRRELAQLVRRLRAIHRMKLSSDAMAEQIGEALSEAGVVSGLISFTTMGVAASDGSDGALRIDKRKLREAEVGWGQAGIRPLEHVSIG